MEQLADTVLELLDDTAQAVEDLSKYQRNFTGRAFEQLADPDPFTITSNDIVAVSMLSVNVPADAALRIVTDDSPRIRSLLRQVPAGASIVDCGTALDRGEAAWTLWTLLESYSGMGPTTVSKVLAVKRPALIPIHDSYVSQALGLDPYAVGQWEAWHRAFTGPRSDELIAAATTITDRAKAEHLSALRVIDIVIWMHQRRERRAEQPHS